MKTRTPPYAVLLQERIGAVLAATMLTLRALHGYRMGSVLPVTVIMVLSAYLGMVFGWVSPLALLPRAAQITPFIYPLF